MSRSERPRSRRFAEVVVAAACLMLVVASCGRRPPPAVVGAPLSLAALLSGSGAAEAAAGFARALAPRPFSFPDDHGPHPAFRSEWWYFTGVLRGREASGRLRRFGYQMTIFRQALAAEVAPRPSAWATRDVYMAHLAIADVDGPATGDRRFQAYQRFARDGLSLAGAQARPFAVWVDDWRMSGPEVAGPTIFPVNLRARDGDSALELAVGAGRGPIAQGDRGLSAKGPQPGNASYYYSCTRLPTRGRLTVQGQGFDVEGDSWLDREWSTSALAGDVVGWDWLGVELSDGRDLMMYRLRTRAGAATAESRVTLIAPDGRPRLLEPAAFTVTPVGAWVSPHTGARYPAGLRVQAPGEALDVTARPLLADQELALAVRYWEGAVAVEGTSAGAALTGSGYLELTGY